MRIFVFLIALLLLVAPVMGQEMTPPDMVEVIDGSTPAPPIVVEVPSDKSDLYFIVILLVNAVLNAAVAIRAITQGRDVFGALADFLKKQTVDDEDLTARLKREYANADPTRKAVIEFLLTAADTLSRLTPDERDDFIQYWTNTIRQREAASMAKKLAQRTAPPSDGLRLG